MHAYGHQWSCQLAFNPQMQPGSGLTDGEGVERLWSRLRKLIGITRSSGVRSHGLQSVSLMLEQRARRLWLLDRHGQAIVLELRDDLGDWLRRRIKHCLTTLEKVELILRECRVPEAVLRQEWELQQQSQLSLRARKTPIIGCDR